LAYFWHYFGTITGRQVECMEPKGQILLEILLKQGKVPVPYFGLVYLNFVSARIEISEFSIYPPYQTLSFLEDNKVSISDLRMAYDKLGQDRGIGEELDQEFSKAFNRLINFQEVSFERFGLFKKTESGIHFQASYPFHEWLVPPSTKVSIKPVAQQFTGKHVVDTDTMIHTPKKPTRKIPWLPIILGLTFLMIFGYLMNRSSDKTPKKMENLKTEVVDVSDDSTDVTLADTTNFDKPNEIKVPNNEDSPTSKKSNSTTNPKPETKTTETVGSCTIITGAFSRNANVIQMKRKIERFGYEAVIIKNGNLTRVGIKTQCNPSEYKSIINKIRAQVEPRSWYLEPKLEI